jgi:hypothetical protein
MAMEGVDTSFVPVKFPRKNTSSNNACFKCIFIKVRLCLKGPAVTFRIILKLNLNKWDVRM